MDKIRSVFADYWRVLLAAGAAAIAVALLYSFRLGSLTSYQLSNAEALSHSNDLDWRTFILNPINAPYKAVDYIFIHISPHSAGFARIASVLFALLAVGLFYLILYRWHGKRSAVLTTLLFCTSGWVLHVGRLANGSSILLVIPLLFILFASWLTKTENHGKALLIMTIATGLAIFTPGAIWFLLATFALYIKSVVKHISNAGFIEKCISMVVLAYFLIMLAVVLLRSPELYKAWLAIPATLPQPVTALAQWADSVIYLFVRGPSDQAMWLAHVPILDMFTAAMCLAGVYFYARHFKNVRSQLLAIFLIIGSILVSFQGAAAMSYIVPIVYLLAGTGLTYVLRKWLLVFPRNPIARSIGIGLIYLVVATACVYQITSYFIAWRYSPATVATFKERI